MRLPICDWYGRRAAACGLALFALALFATPTSRAQSAWTLTTADFESRPVTLISIDNAGAKVTQQQGAEATVPWQQILQLERVADPSKPAGKPEGAKFTLHLANGDRIAGEAAALEGENLSWAAPAAGPVAVKLKQVIAVTRGSEPAPRRDPNRAPAAEDVVSLTNGDTARGLISAIDKAAVTVTGEGNVPVVVPWESVRTVVLAAVPREPAARERGVRLTLADGSVLSGAAVTFAGDKAALTAAGDGAKRELPAVAVNVIEQTNGPVAWLSSLPPEESVHTPFLETVFPARMDRTVRGEAIRFGDRTFARGIGVHAYSRLVWQLPGNYKSFRTRYAIDGDKPYANVTVRVKLDDKVVHEVQDVVAGALADVVKLPLAGAKTLTLEVDYGKTYDVQDRFNWIEPALLAE